jgi:hypothetical protein
MTARAFAATDILMKSRTIAAPDGGAMSGGLRIALSVVDAVAAMFGARSRGIRAYGPYFA